MKKKILIPIIICLVLVVGIVCFLLFGKNGGSSTKTTIITLDINPSIEIRMTDEKVESVKALNDDAKDIVNDDLVGKSLEETLSVIAKNAVEKGYIDPERSEIIVYAKGKIGRDDVERKIRDSFAEQNIDPYLVFVENVTKEDEKLAEEYHISPAKANYINEIIKENDNVDVASLIDKSVHELDEVKQTGNYCDDGYTLEGDFCVKEIERFAATKGETCPREYSERDGKCYKEAGVIDLDEYYCPDDFELEGKKCVRRETMNAVPASYTCPSGVLKTKGEAHLTDSRAGDANDPICVDSNYTQAVSVCDLPKNDPTERLSSGGKCYWHRAPVIDTGCPGKIQVNGECWDDATGIYVCPNAKNNETVKKGDYCYTVLKGVQPTPSTYKCDNPEWKLEGTTCVGTQTIDAFQKRDCPSGYTMDDNDRCIDYNSVTEKEIGYYCDREDSRLEGNDCVVFERVEAKHN